MSRQRVFLNQEVPTTTTKLTPSGNNFRLTDIIATVAGVEYEFGGYAENGDAIWALKPNAAALALKAPLASPNFTGDIDIAGATSGTAKIKTADVAGTPTLTLPIVTGTFALNEKVVQRYLTFTAGENIAAKQWCYLKSDGKMWLAKADAEATSSGFICRATEAINAESSGVFQKRGEFTDESLTVGSKYYLSAATAGAMTTTAPSTATNIVRILGHAIAADNFVVDVDQGWLVV